MLLRISPLSASISRGEQAAQLLIQHVLAFRLHRAGIVEGDQIAGGRLEHVRRFRRGVVGVLPLAAHELAGDLAVVHDAVLPVPLTGPVAVPVNGILFW